MRISLRKRLPPRPTVIETHGGRGEIFKRVYFDVDRGLVLDTDLGCVEHLAAQRPTWQVYQAQAERALELGLGSDLECDLLDVDPYGQPWPVLEAFFGSDRPFPRVMGIAVNDGLRQSLGLQAGWGCRSMQLAVERFGNAALNDRYLEVAEWNLRRIVALRGYELTHWAGYYTGHAGDLTHYAAVLERS